MEDHIYRHLTAGAILIEPSYSILAICSALCLGQSKRNFIPPELYKNMLARWLDS